jgi:tetratricopeptide (TPR) repeat protein
MGDLDNIVLMALRKEPERRYKSVEALAGDIENHLRGLPVAAHPNTFSYRAAKFWQRNKIAVSAAALIVLALLTGLTVALWQAQVARRERDRAEKRFNDVRQLSNSLLFEITPKIENLNGSTEAREILVKRALAYLDSLAREAQTDAQLQSELAAAYEKIGELQANSNKPSLNDNAGAIGSYLKAQQIRLRLPETTENQRLLAENYRDYSDVVFAQNDVKGSLNASTQALNIYKKLLAANSQSLALQTAYLDTQLGYGTTFSIINQYGEAIPIFQKTIADLASLDQNNREVQKLTALALAQLGNALSWDGKQPEAETEMAKAVKIIDDLVAANPNDNAIRRNAFRIYSLASAIYEAIKNEVALTFAQKALQTALHAVEVDAADSRAKSNLSNAYSRVGICLVNVKQVSAALPQLQKAANLLRDLTAQEPKNLSYQRRYGLLYQRFGDAQALEKNYPEAVKAYRQAADLFAGIARLDDKNTLARRDEAQALKNVGETQVKLNQRAEAAQTFQRALDILNNLKAQNALGQVDLNMIAEVQTALEKLATGKR